MKETIEIQGKKVEFSWGPVVKVHTIGDYDIVEYRPEIFDNNRGTGKYYEGETSFHPYVNGKDTMHSYSSLDTAIIGAISRKYDGPNAQAAYYISKMLNME